MLDEFRYIPYQDLLFKVDQLQIWRYIIGNIEVGDFFLNPFRNDRSKGSCCLYWTGEVLRLKDFAHAETNNMDCIRGYMRMYPNLTWNQVCTNLINLTVPKLTTSSYKILPGIVKTEYELFYKEWTNDFNYWKDRGVSLEQLNRKETLVRPINGFIQKGKFTQETHFNDLAFVYHFDTRIKIYFPTRSKPRFVGNAKGTDLWHLKRGSDILVIQKSHKDFLILENLCDYDLLVTQNETPILSSDIMFDLETYSKVLIWFDPDQAGIEGANRLKNQFIYTPVEIITSSGGKDLDEMYINHGEKYCLNFIKNNVC